MINATMIYGGNDCCHIKNDNGDKICIMPLIREIYINPEMERLNDKYLISSHSGEMIPSSMGDTGQEMFAAKLFLFYQLLSSPVWIADKSMLYFAKRINETFEPTNLEKRKFLSRVLIEGIEVLFPTEALLENQKIKRKTHFSTE
jgi:hypothetical protein